MNKDQIDLVKNILGDDIFDTLEKYEIHKLSTQTVVDPVEIKTALQIVPRSILGWLFANLRNLELDKTTDIELPFCDGILSIIKYSSDNYSGNILSKSDKKKLVEFKYRSLPSIGLLILTTFELYDINLLDEIKEDKSEKVEKLQDIIDERLSLHKLISDVVDKRISEREAINKLIHEKLHSHVTMVNIEQQEEPMNKKSKLRSFLEARETKKDSIIQVDKSEIKCPDCDTTLYKGEDHIKLCICYGNHINKKIKINKTENGAKLKFPKKFDIENVEMLLDAIKGKSI